MSLLKIKRIPLYFKRFSWEIDFHEMKVLPFLMVFVNCVYMTMSLPALDMQLLSYAVQACVILSFVLMSILCLKDMELTRYGFLYVIFSFFLFGISIIFSQDIKNCIYTMISILLSLLIFKFYNNNVRFIIYAFAIALSFCVYANFLHLITHPTLWLIREEKEGSGYLLGFNYNQMGCRMMIALVTSAICSKFSKTGKFNFIILAIVCVASLTFVGSMTSLSSIILFLTFCILPSAKLREIGILALFVVYLLFQTFVVCSGKGLENNEFAVYIIEDVLHKDITFTHRTYMWDSALKTIAKSPIFGWGYVNMDWYRSFMSSQASGPHNFILSIFINGGILLFSLFIVIAYKSLCEMKSFFQERMGQILIFGTICLYFMALMEMYPYPIMMYLFILMFYYPYIGSKKFAL